MSVIVSLAFWTSSGLSGSNRNSKSPYPVFSTSIPGKGLLLFLIVFSMVLSCASGGSIRPRRFRVHREGEELQSQQSTRPSWQKLTLRRLPERFQARAGRFRCRLCPSRIQHEGRSVFEAGGPATLSEPISHCLFCIGCPGQIQFLRPAHTEPCNFDAPTVLEQCCQHLWS